MKILSDRSFKFLRRAYREETGLRAELIAPDGLQLSCRDPDCPCQLPVLRHARRDALQQAVRWGEPYVFFLAPGVVSWVVPVVDGWELRGGVSGGGVLVEADADVTASVNYLTQAGCSRDAARRYVGSLREGAIETAGQWAWRLYEMIYAISGLTPSLLTRNRDDARQQRQIGEAIQEQKQDAEPQTFSIADEQLLLSLLRVGDRNGARSVLNRMLATMFLSSPALPLLQARCIEMIGYLVRAAIEDNPLLAVLMESHRTWLEQIIAAPTFEALCSAVRDVLDSFIGITIRQGHNRSSRHVQSIMDYLATHYTERVSLDELAQHVGMSRFHVARMIKQCTGKTVTQHVRSLRIQRACELLDRTEMSYAEMAYDLGFTDQSYFIKQFRQMTGSTPARYRRERRSGARYTVPLD